MKKTLFCDFIWLKRLEKCSARHKSNSNEVHNFWWCADPKIAQRSWKRFAPCLWSLDNKFIWAFWPFFPWADLICFWSCYMMKYRLHLKDIVLKKYKLWPKNEHSTTHKPRFGVKSQGTAKKFKSSTCLTQFPTSVDSY